VRAGEDLQSVEALPRRPLRELPGLLRRVDRTAVPRAAHGEDVRDDARRDDLVARAAVALVQAPVGAVTAARLAHRGDAVPEPELVDVLRGRPLLRAAGVAVHVDEAGQHPEVAAVDLLRRAGRPSLRLDRDQRRTDDADLADAVPLDDDVGRPDRRCAGAVDDGGAADDEPLERALPFAG